MYSLTHEYITSILDYNPDTGIFTWKIYTNSRAKIGNPAGYIQPGTGYMKLTINNIKYAAHRVAWFYTYKQWPKDMIDHIHGIKHDNRLCNLREATNSQNQRNRGPNKNNTSGYKGVHLDKQRNKWNAIIEHNKKKYFLGTFDNPEDAAIAYQAAAIRYHGDFRKLD